MEKTIDKQDTMFQLIASEQSISVKQVKNVISMLDEGNTVPFIARYRKEQTGSLDEVQIRDIMERAQYIQNLEQRKEEVVRLIDEQGKLTPELQQSIIKAMKLQEIEDLYRPYKQKRRTKATIAKEKGLEPFAQWLLTFPKQGSLDEEASKYLSQEKEVTSIEDVIAGANDIIAEMVSDEAEGRKWIRRETHVKGLLSLVKDAEKDEKKVYEMYYEYEEPVSKIVPPSDSCFEPGEKEDILRVSIKPNVDYILQYLNKKWIKDKSSFAAPIVRKRLRMAINVSFNHLLKEISGMN